MLIFINNFYMNKIIILVDYKFEFQCSIEDLKNYSSMNINKIVKYLNQYNYNVEVITFSDFDFTRNYKNVFILYHSSEDSGLYYKSYIEDICFFLENQGAILIPKLLYLRSHHNKSLMEMLRYTFKNESLRSLQSCIYGTYEDSIKKNINLNFPVVLKASEGSGSNGVILVKNKKEYKYYIKKISRVKLFNSISDLIKYYLNNIFRKKNKRAYTEYRKKFIVQPFIKNLSGDFKVLYYSGKYYIIGRKNRKNDFRASGSGLIYNVNHNEAFGVLSFFKILVNEIDEEIIGADIAFDGTRYHLIEFQIWNFIGPYALQSSKCWYEWNLLEECWEIKHGYSELEYEYCRSVHFHIFKLNNKKYFE